MEKNINIEKDAQGIQNDEVATLTTEQMVENFQNDLEAYKKAIELTKKDKANYEAQLEVDKVIWDVLSKPNSYRKITPEYEFEKDERYWDALSEKQNYKIRMDRALAEKQLGQYDETLKMQEQAVKDTQDKLARFGGADNE